MTSVSRPHAVACSLGTCLTKKNDLAGARNCFEQVNPPDLESIHELMSSSRPCRELELCPQAIAKEPNPVSLRELSQLLRALAPGTEEHAANVRDSVEKAKQAQHLRCANRSIES